MLEYSCFTDLYYFQVYNKVIPLYVYLFFSRFFPHVCYFIVLGRVLSVLQ